MELHNHPTLPCSQWPPGIQNMPAPCQHPKSGSMDLPVTWVACSEVRTLDECAILLPPLEEKSLAVLFLLIMPSCATYSKLTQTVFRTPSHPNYASFISTLNEERRTATWEIL